MGCLRPSDSFRRDGLLHVPLFVAAATDTYLGRAEVRPSERGLMPLMLGGGRTVNPFRDFHG